MQRSQLPSSGEVWIARYERVGGTVGHEQAGLRPALIVSHDAFNHATGLVAAVPITRTLRAATLDLPIAPPEGGLLTASTVLSGQVRTVSHPRLQTVLGSVSPALLEAALRRVRSRFTP